MNKKIFLQQMGAIDEKYIEEAAGNLRTKWSAAGKLAAAAACFLMVCAVLAIPFAGNLLSPQVSSENALPVVWDEEEGRFVKKNEINPNQDSFYYNGYRAAIASGDYQGYRSARVLDEGYVGEKLGSAEIDSFLFYFSSGKTEDHRYLAAEVYEIRGISPADAVCIRYLEIGQSNTLTHYYVFCNANVTDPSWSGLWERFAFDEYLSLSDTAEMLIGDGGCVQKVRYRFSDASALREMLSHVSGAAEADMDERDFSALASSADKMLTLSAQCFSSGQYGTIQILDNGYLVTGISGSVKVFDIGAENAAWLMAWIEESGEILYSVKYDENGLPEQESSEGLESTVALETTVSAGRDR